MNLPASPLLAQRRIAVVAPSGAPLDDVAVLRGLQVLEQLGCEVHNYYQAEQRFERFAASDAERAAQLHAAAANPAVDIILALRGSYGLSRILPLLDLDMLAASGKLLVGYSDFTPLHQAMLARGRFSLAGPMLCDDFTREAPSAYTLAQFAAALSAVAAGAPHRVEFDSPDSADVAVDGCLWGGNLAMLVHTLGTPYWHEPQQGILFLEDIGEHPYRIERMLLQLHFAGVLSRQQAIVLGDFSAYRLVANDNGYDFASMLAYIRSICAVPLVCGLPFGHIRERASLVVGSQAQLRVRSGVADLSMHFPVDQQLR